MILALKLLLTPLLIAVVTLVSRKWGPGVSGWFIGFPFTSGPVSLILAIQDGRGFATQAAIGSIGGISSVCIYALVYSLVCAYASWPVSVIAAVAAFMAVTALWQQIHMALVPTFLAAAAIIVTVYTIMPRGACHSSASRPPAWDLPARMILATSFVVALTTFSSLTGPQLSGLINPFPIFSIILASFTHSQLGSNATQLLLRGLVTGTVSYASFFLVTGALLPYLALVWVYSLAVVAALLVSTLTLKLTQKAESQISVQ
jgi:hypothetical protein